MKHTILLQVLKWAGTILTVSGALATSLRMDPLNVVLFNSGACLWLWAALMMKDRALITVNASLLAIYIIGAAIRILD